MESVEYLKLQSRDCSVLTQNPNEYIRQGFHAIEIYKDDAVNTDIGARFIELATLETDADPLGFWFTIGSRTCEKHWNETLWKVEVEQAFLLSQAADSDQWQVAPRSSGDPEHLAYSVPEPKSARVYMRRLHRRTASPVGGGEDGIQPSLDCLEWAIHRTYRKEYSWGPALVHEATCGLLVPESARVDKHRRALTYWPFHYPKARMYKFQMREPLDNRSRKCELSYLVMPLSAADNEQRDFVSTRPYLEKAGLKILKGLKSWSERFNVETLASTYTKRVNHDIIYPQERFRKKYNDLRAKYEYWADQWPESTDPQKYVFEEMGIAAYLIALWEYENENRAEHGESKSASEVEKKKKKFVDLGCGNGFLVYLLVSEGYDGVGIDLQKRKIWEIYPKETQDAIQLYKVDLAFDAIQETSRSLEDFEWILGNHSDELTPWIPVIAMANQAKLFLLPCCFWDFEQRMSFGRLPEFGDGRYRRYLWYIAMILEACGLTYFIDNLRIPSTRCIAFVCLLPSSKNYDHTKDSLVALSREMLGRAVVRDDLVLKLNPELQEMRDSKKKVKNHKQVANQNNSDQD